MKRLVLLGFLFAAAAAQPAFLLSLRDHPAWKAAEARRAATALNARLSPNWIELDASGGWSRRELDEGAPCPFLRDPDPTNDVLCSFLTPDLPDEFTQAQIGITLRPLPFGDYADRQRQRSVDDREAELEFRLARARMEASALRAALGVIEAERGLALSSEARLLAEKALAATRLRHQNGAASGRELRDAGLALDQARERVRTGQERLELAQATLRTFTDEAPPDPPWFRSPLPRAEPPDVQRARMQLERARIARSNARRDAWPIVQLEYRRQLDEQNLLGVAVESRTLGTRFYFDHASYADPARSRTKSEVKIGARLDLSVDTWAGMENARLLVEAARRSLEGALRSSEIEVRRYRDAIQQRTRAVALAERALENARRTEDESAHRLELGLTSPLEHLDRQLDRATAEFELIKARHDVLRAQLDYLVYLGIPPSEVWR